MPLLVVRVCVFIEGPFHSYPTLSDTSPHILMSDPVYHTHSQHPPPSSNTTHFYVKVHLLKDLSTKLSPPPLHPLISPPSNNTPSNNTLSNNITSNNNLSSYNTHFYAKVHLLRDLSTKLSPRPPTVSPKCSQKFTLPPPE